MIKASTAIICFSPNSGGMELAALKLTKTLSKYINATLIMQTDKFMHDQCLNNSDYSDIKYKTIKFNMTFSPSIIFQTRKIIKEKI